MTIARAIALWPAPPEHRFLSSPDATRRECLFATFTAGPGLPYIAQEPNFPLANLSG
jgi:hypothetical protein